MLFIIPDRERETAKRKLGKGRESFFSRPQPDSLWKFFEQSWPLQDDDVVVVETGNNDNGQIAGRNVRGGGKNNAKGILTLLP